MADNPTVWLQAHINAGIHLREEGRPLKTLPGSKEWEAKAETWRVDLRNGLETRRSGDGQCIDVLGDLICESLPPDHPWHERLTTELLAVSTTGTEQPGNNSFNYHCTRIRKAEKILEEWKTAKPQPPKPAGPTEIAQDEFDTWFEAEVAKAKPGDRRSREDTQKFAQDHFSCPIPIEWAKTAHSIRSAILPLDHTWRTRGRRPDN